MSSIRDFGAKGDGQTDDSDAFQHAIDKGNGEVILPRGEYRITRTIVIPLDRSDRIGIRGTGTARVIMSAAGPAFHLVGTHDKTALPTDFRDVVWQKERMPHLSDFEIVGGNAMADGIRIEGVMQPTLRGLLIRKCRHGIHLVKRNRNVLIADCHIYDNTGVGVFLDTLNLHQININSNHISYCRQAGILVKNGEIRNIQIVGNDIEYNYVADREDCADVYFDAREGTIREGAIVGNTIQAKESRGGANVRLRGIGPSSPNAVGMLSISGNLIGSQETALHLQACRGVTITGNSIYSGYRQSVIAEDSEAIVFSGNVVPVLASVATQAADRKLVMIAGPVSHPPLMHEFKAGSMLLQKRLENVKGLKTTLILNGWPSKTVDGQKVDDNSVFEGADAIFIYSDGGGRHLAVQNDRLEVLRGLMKKGVSLGLAHYAVEVVPEKGGAEWKEWVGGHYENAFSCNPIFDAEFKSLPVHAITRGVKPFTTKDEWYFNMRFRDGKAGVKDILVATPSDAVRDGPYVSPKGPYPHIQAAKGRPETMMWAVERPDGGRGFGFTGGHFHLCLLYTSPSPRD